MKLSKVAVFCGSSAGGDSVYGAGADRLARELTRRHIGLVYGGADVGLMGRIARAVLSHGGEVTGVVPEFLMEYEVAFRDLPDLQIVGSMHERKAQMAALSDGFIAMPGGFGTLEEFFEILTWGQLGRHRKPCGLLNTAGYYQHLIDFLDYAVARRFVRPEHRAMMLVEEDPRRLLDRFEDYAAAPQSGKWIDRDGDET